MILKVMKEDKNLSGVYQIRNIVNNKLYIGSTIGFKKRLEEHLFALRRNVHGNSHLQRAWNKYGEDNFEYSILERCELIKCIEAEQKWLDKLKPEYNILKFSRNSLGYKHTEESLILIGQKSKERGPHINTIKAMNDASRGKKRSKEHVEKMVEGKRVSIVQLTLAGEFVKEWDSIAEANTGLGLSRVNSNISKCCRWNYELNGEIKCKSLKGFLWVYGDRYNRELKYVYKDSRIVERNFLLLDN